MHSDEQDRCSFCGGNLFLDTDGDTKCLQCGRRPAHPISQQEVAMTAKRTRVQEPKESPERLEYVELDRIKPNPYQLEGRDDPQPILDMAESIKLHGQIETPKSRPAGKDVELADGHIRLAALRLLAKQRDKRPMRLIIDPTLTDRQMADIAMEENRRRTAPNPIAEARFYRRYLDEFKVTQNALAEHMGCSREEIANTLRLLALPEYIQAQIVSRETTYGHGRTLLILNRFPEKQQQVAKALLAKPCSVQELSQRIEQSLLLGSRTLSKLSRRPPLFDLAECPKCPDRMMLSPYPGSQKEACCVDPTCWDKKQTAAQEEHDRKRQEELATGGAGGEISRDSLNQGEFVILSSYETGRMDNSKECQSCPQRRLMRPHDRAELQEICIDPKCYKQKVAKKTLAENERAHQEEEERSQRIEAALKKLGGTGRTCYLVMIGMILDVSWNEVSKWFRATYDPSDAKNTPSADILQKQSREALQLMLPRLLVEVYRARYSWNKERVEAVIQHLEGNTPGG